MLGEIEPQIVRQLFMKAKEYAGVIDLTLGDPDLPTPADVSRAGCEAILQGKTKYTANAGLPELREAIAEDIKRRLGLSYDPQSEIIVTVGAMGALYLATLCLFDPGDEMIILAPHWPNYTNMVKMCRATPVFVNCYGAENIAALRENVLAAVTPRTKALILNSPSNPTGQVLPAEALAGLAEIAITRDLTVYSDEVYHSILFGGRAHESIAALPGMQARTILIDSLSKRFSMTGWRIGCAAAPGSLIAQMTQMQEHIVACAPMFCQIAAAEALRHGRSAEKEINGAFESRCTVMAEGINQIEGLRCRMPEGAFYLFVDIRALGIPSIDFAFRLLDAERVALVPGVAFGPYGEGYVRIACTVPEDALRAGLDRIARFVGTLSAR